MDKLLPPTALRFNRLLVTAGLLSPSLAFPDVDQLGPSGQWSVDITHIHTLVTPLAKSPPDDEVFCRGKVETQRLARVSLMP